MPPLAYMRPGIRSVLNQERSSYQSTGATAPKHTVPSRVQPIVCQQGIAFGGRQASHHGAASIQNGDGEGAPGRNLCPAYAPQHAERMGPYQCPRILSEWQGMV